MNKKKITVVLSVLMLLAGGVLIYSKKMNQETMVFDLQSNNITAISGGIEDFRPWVELVMSVGGWLVSTFDDGFYHCRCHKSVNACMGGRQISFRSSCYKGEQEVNCFDFVEYCNK